VAAVTADPRFELVWNEAVRALDVQQRMIDEARQRAGTLLTAASIVSTFLGAEALADDNPSGWSTVGIVSFVLVVLACTYVLWPRRFTLVTSPTQLIGDHIDSELPNEIDQMRWEISTHLEVNYDANDSPRVTLTRFRGHGVSVLRD
jgi:hypothetical protein